MLNSTLQAQAKRFPVPRIAGVPHDAADEIVRRDMRPEFLLHHIRTFTMGNYGDRGIMGTPYQLKCFNRYGVPEFPMGTP